MKFNSEKDIAKILINWLKDLKWDVYQEVEIKPFNSIADIVATQNNVSWTIEVKQNMSLVLLSQAYNYIWQSNYVSIAIPASNHKTKYNVANIFCKDYGIGILRITNNDVYIELNPKFHKIHKKLNINQKLNENQKNWAEAGNNLKQRWSPFQQTCKNIKEYIKENQGSCLKDVINNVNHHYSTPSTAKSCISKWIKEGIIDGIKIKKDGKKIILFVE